MSRSSPIYILHTAVGKKMIAKKTKSNSLILPKPLQKQLGWEQRLVGRSVKPAVSIWAFPSLSYYMALICGCKKAFEIRSSISIYSTSLVSNGYMELWQWSEMWLTQRIYISLCMLSSLKVYLWRYRDLCGRWHTSMGALHRWSQGNDRKHSNAQKDTVLRQI